ncbi:MAG: alsD [Gemmatimonadetes bacterium]|nr:alsD [Gemmatimonadota bacterium]
MISMQPRNARPRRAFRILPIAATLCAVAGLVCVAPACSDARANVAPVQSAPVYLDQFNPFIALQNGVLDGSFTVGQLKGVGNFALGAANALNGEMMMLDGVFYRFDVGGRAVVAPNTQHMPFALVSRWPVATATRSTLPPGTTYPNPPAFDPFFRSANRFYSLRAHGTFACMVVRTFAPQTKPYPPVSRIRMKVDTLRNVTGTFIGYREPPFVGGTSYPGYHVHFIDDAHVHGGHVLNFRTGTAGIVLTHADLGGLRLHPDTTQLYLHADLTQVMTGTPPPPPVPPIGCPAA